VVTKTDLGLRNLLDFVTIGCSHSTATSVYPDTSSIKTWILVTYLDQSGMNLALLISFNCRECIPGTQFFGRICLEPIS
jgi:hypothetical protein